MKTRLLSILSASPTTTKVKHYLGLPPELTGGHDTRQEMGSPAYLVIEAESDGIYLYRYDNQGNEVGDTWHRNVDDAKHQADYEYGDLIEEWRDVPVEVQDASAFGLARLKEASNP
jgi:hypothetical protein